MPFAVTVTRVNEDMQQGTEVTFEAEAVTVDVEGRVSVLMPGGRGATFGPAAWGSVTIERVKGR